MPAFRERPPRWAGGTTYRDVAIPRQHVSPIPERSKPLGKLSRFSTSVADIHRAEAGNADGQLYDLASCDTLDE